MDSIGAEKPHAVCVPYPAQGHLTPMMQLAKILHSRGFHVTFVNTEYNRRRLLKSRGPAALRGLDGFRFDAIPDGLPQSDDDADRTQDITSLTDSLTKNALAPFRHLITRLNDPLSGVPPVSCIISDGIMSFTLDAAEEFHIPEVMLWTTAACTVMCYLQYQQLIDRGLTPLKSECDLTNGYLDTTIADGIPGMKNMRLRDFPSFVRTTDANDILLNSLNHDAQQASRARAIVLNTFDDLERPVLEAMRSMSILPPIYTIGPLSLLAKHTHMMPEGSTPLSSSLSSSLWVEDASCLEWLDSKAPASVVYVNFGSIAVMTHEQMIEFAWGLASSNYDFFWVVRSDLVKGAGGLIFPPEFLVEIEKRGLLGSWCDQDAVLGHPTIGGFLTHSGWNSTLESLSSGVPMMSWPFFSDQPTNCRYVCTEWGVGMEINGDVKREEVEGLVRELMGGQKGIEMRSKASEWKKSAIRAAEEGGPSMANLDKLVNQVLLSRN